MRFDAWMERLERLYGATIPVAEWPVYREIYDAGESPEDVIDEWGRAADFCTVQ